MKSSKVILSAVLTVWALFVFFASNGPADVQERAHEWAASPIFQWFPLTLLAFASSRLTIAVTCLALGGVAGWWLGRAHAHARQKPSWWLALATDMTLLAHGIEQLLPHDSVQGINAQLMVVGLKAQQYGLAFPTEQAGFAHLDDFVPYLLRVSALLREGEVDTARSMSRQLASAPLRLS
jgi:hypothetical protein